MVMQLATREVQVSTDADDGDDEEGDAWLGVREYMRLRCQSMRTHSVLNYKDLTFWGGDLSEFFAA